MRVINSKFSRFIFYVSILFCIGFVFQCFVFASSMEETTVILGDANLNEEEQEVLDLINEQREDNGLSKLQPYEELQKVAKLKAEDIVNNEYFSHTSPTYGTPFEMLKQEGVVYKFAGENLAGNETGYKAVTAWMNSPAHRSNILDSDYEYTGICVVDSDIYGKVYVQLFMGV